jgi:hypothetical protein
LKAKISRINDAFAEGTLSAPEMKDLKNPLIAKKTELEQQIVTLEKSKTQRLEPIKRWISEANHVEKLVSSDNLAELKTVLRRVGSNRQLRSRIITVSFKIPWSYLAETSLAVQKTNDVSEQHSTWWSLLNQIRTFFDDSVFEKMPGSVPGHGDRGIRTKPGLLRDLDSNSVCP